MRILIEKDTIRKFSFLRALPTLNNLQRSNDFPLTSQVEISFEINRSAQRHQQHRASYRNSPTTHKTFQPWWCLSFATLLSKFFFDRDQPLQHSHPWKVSMKLTHCAASERPGALKREETPEDGRLTLFRGTHSTFSECGGTFSRFS